jgi:hypothetical protein
MKLYYYLSENIGFLFSYNGKSYKIKFFIKKYNQW